MITAKNRIAPLRQISIPRLELCGAVIVSCLVEHTVKSSNYKCERIICFTDSRIVLGQIHNESFRFNTFVGNHIYESHSNSSINFSISPEEIPMDLVSRGCSPTDD